MQLPISCCFLPVRAALGVSSAQRQELPAKINGGFAEQSLAWLQEHQLRQQSAHTENMTYRHSQHCAPGAVLQFSPQLYDPLRAEHTVKLSVVKTDAKGC